MLKRYLRALLYVVLVVSALFALVLAFLPPLDVNMRQRANEASTVGKVDTIIKLERTYAANHPTNGYSCELSRLRSSEPKTNEFDPEDFLKTGESLRFRYGLRCDKAPDGKALHFTLTAVPIEPVVGRFKYRAFCADDSGLIRYDTDGSGDKCIAAGKPILR